MNKIKVRDLRHYIKLFVPPVLEPPIKKALRFLDADWHKRYVGGLWEEIGRVQFDFLVEQGLNPEGYLLDIGCGSLRGGIHFIRYLEPGHYLGVDISPEILDAAKDQLKRNELMHKDPILIEMGDFDFRRLGREFDFVLAKGLFTILPLNSIIKCVMNVEKVLAREGRFFASMYENPAGKSNLEPITHPGIGGASTETAYFDKTPYHYDFETFEWICEGTTLNVSYVDDFEHPTEEKMLVFRKEPTP